MMAAMALRASAAIVVPPLGTAGRLAACQPAAVETAVAPAHKTYDAKVFFDTTAVERVALLSLLDRAREQLQAELLPDGYNIGINDGTAAGQTVPHLHIHLIDWYQIVCQLCKQ